MRVAAFDVVIAIAVALPLTVLADDGPVAISEHFLVKKVSGTRLLAPRWEGIEVFARLAGQGPQYLGFALTRAGEASYAMSKDGRSLVFRHSDWQARPDSRREPGIYQYAQGAGLKLLYLESEIQGYGVWRGERERPSDILPFRRRSASAQGVSVWALRATGEEFPLALLDATPLHRAALEGRTEECEKLVMEGADSNATTYWNFTALDLAIIQDHEDTAIRLLDLKADPNAGRYPAFNRAVMLGRMKVVQALLARGADVNAADAHGYTPLHLAVFAGSRLVGGVNEYFPSAVTPRSVLDRNVSAPLVGMLLEKGANPALKDKYGMTALGAVGRATPEEVKRLLEAAGPAGSDPCDQILADVTADAHPDIRWISARPGVSSDRALGCILRSAKDDATIEVTGYMTSGLYRFLRECRAEKDTLIFRLFEYKEKARPYLLRLHKDLFVEPRTYVVVRSHRLSVGSYQHSIAQKGNDGESITLCSPGG